MNYQPPGTYKGEPALGILIMADGSEFNLKSDPGDALVLRTKCLCGERVPPPGPSLPRLQFHEHHFLREPGGFRIFREMVFEP